MRPLLLAALIALVPATAFARCPAVPDDKDSHYVERQTELTLCRAAEVHQTAAAKAQEMQFQADLQAATKNFELELRMQQNFAAAKPPLPQF